MGDHAPDLPYRPVSPARPAATEHSRALDGPRRVHDARHYAALDLGTNNCRLLIARPQGDGFAVVDAFSRIVRLGEGLAASGRLSEAAVERTIAALRICAEKLRRRNVALSRAVATEACRRAAHGAEFIARAPAEPRIHHDVITPQAEARLAVLGCHALIEPGEGAALVFDIGGGSTELVLVETGAGPPRVLDWHSAPWGGVSLTETAQAVQAQTTLDGRIAAYARMRSLVADSMAAFARRLPPAAAPRLLGTSGTVTTLGSVHLGLAHYDRARVDGLVVPAAAMRAIAASLSRMDLAERASLPCIGTERADLVVAGCAILETILDLWPAPRVAIADRGLREGILRRLMGGER